MPDPLRVAKRLHDLLTERAHVETRHLPSDLVGAAENGSWVVGFDRKGGYVHDELFHPEMRNLLLSGSDVSRKRMLELMVSQNSDVQFTVVKMDDGRDRLGHYDNVRTVPVHDDGVDDEPMWDAFQHSVLPTLDDGRHVVVFENPTSAKFWMENVVSLNSIAQPDEESNIGDNVRFVFSFYNAELRRARLLAGLSRVMMLSGASYSMKEKYIIHSTDSGRYRLEGQHGYYVPKPSILTRGTPFRAFLPHETV